MGGVVILQSIVTSGLLIPVGSLICNFGLINVVYRTDRLIKTVYKLRQRSEDYYNNQNSCPLRYWTIIIIIGTLCHVHRNVSVMHVLNV